MNTNLRLFLFFIIITVLLLHKRIFNFSVKRKLSKCQQYAKVTSDER